jgi:hypothetical protein
MKLTKKFWTWISQVAAAIFLLWRMDLLCTIFGQIPNVDLSQLNFEIGVVKLGAVLWLSWLIWRAYQGFFRTMDFLIDENDHRW